MVAALYVRKDSPYFTLGADCWTKERDATFYNGPYPVVAHPPCRMWGRYSYKALGTNEEKNLGFFAVAQVRKFGGVLEHPAYSKLWSAASLPIPGKFDKFGFSISVNQSWFGHEAKKPTWLYFSWINLQDVVYPLSWELPQTTVPNLCRQKRERTPLLFAKWLFELAKLARPGADLARPGADLARPGADLARPGARSIQKTLFQQGANPEFQQLKLFQ